jgi:HrpA-like RNA helicase
LVRPPREHTLRESVGQYDFDKFAIKDHHLEEFFRLLDKRQVCVIIAPTGAGKSTLLPYRLMMPPSSMPCDFFSRRGQILVTQPRIQATRNIPDFVARHLHGSTLGPGFDVGFRHSGTPNMDRSNKLVYVTDGTLINMIVNNELPQLGVVMIDEAHERSLNIDLILGLLKQQLPRFPHLRLIIASATIDSGKFVDFFGGNDVVGFYEFPGDRPHPIDVRFAEEPVPLDQMPARMPHLVAEKVIKLLQDIDEGREEEGDILAFLHGEKPILRAVSLILDEVDRDRRLAGRVDVMPLFTRLPQHDQDAALQAKKDRNQRRVVISTNVAETSLTVEGIVHVVDSGLINQAEWDLKTNTTFVAAKRHSCAGCRQRWGRAGRMKPGVAHCLYTKAQFEDEKIFSKFSQPEIQRAPLEQIVLTAKISGIDDVRSFPWIEAPSSAELGRAPEVLHRMGALDRDGDITSHGIELRSFAEDPEISNLMILADRFGCATEMATVLAMRRLRSLRDLFRWDRSWDATTKWIVHQRQQSLMAACRDDLEFSLKIWEAWEGSLFQRNQNAQRKRWADEHFVVHETLDRRVSADREGLLRGLSGHKKEEESRPTDFRLLNKLRILLAHGLSTHLYRKDSSPNADESCYMPFLPEPERSPHLIDLHEGATVSISHDSVCRRSSPAIFVCARRRRWLERRSPLKEPSVHICASFIVVLEERWLQAATLNWTELAHFIAIETRVSSGELKGEATPKALFVDQLLPLGSKVTAQNAGGVLRVKQILRPAPRIRMSRRWHPKLEVSETFESDDVDEEQFHFGEESLGLAKEWMDDDDTPPLQVRPCSFDDYSFTAMIEGAEVMPDWVEGIVAGFDLSAIDSPVIRLTLPNHTTPFDEFVRQFRIGDEIQVEVVALERFLHEDRMTYLVVRENSSGLEIVLDPYDLSLIGRNFAFENRLKSGAPLIVSIEEIVPPRGRNELGQVRVSRLRYSAEAVIQFIERFNGKLVEAQIADVTEDGIYIWLNPDIADTDEAVGAFVPTSLLPKRPDEMALYQRCQIIARPRDFTGRRGFSSTTQIAPEPFIRLLRGMRTLEWDAGRGVIELRGPVGWQQRLQLLEAASGNESLIEVVERLFRVSYDLEVRVMDVRLFEALEDLKRSGERVKATVVQVEHDGLVVIFGDGARGKVFREGLPISPKEDLAKFAQVNSELSLMIKEVDMPRNRIVLTSLESVTFVLPDDKMGLLIGQGGATIKRLEIETSTSIRITRGSNNVVVSGKDLCTLRRAIEVLEDHINHYSAVAKLDPSLSRKIFFDERRILNALVHGLGIRVDVERGPDGRTTGRVYLKGGKLSALQAAIFILREADPNAEFVTSPRRSPRIIPAVPPARP